jgi:hypothetical protein
MLETLRGCSSPRIKPERTHSACGARAGLPMVSTGEAFSPVAGVEKEHQAEGPSLSWMPGAQSPRDVLLRQVRNAAPADINDPEGGATHPGRVPCATCSGCGGAARSQTWLLAGLLLGFALTRDSADLGKWGNPLPDRSRRSVSGLPCRFADKLPPIASAGNAGCWMLRSQRLSLFVARVHP